MYEIFDKLLKLNNVTAYKVSKETGIPYSALSEWKMGRSEPKRDKLEKIADYFGVSVDFLIGRDTEMELGIRFSSDEEAKVYIEIMSCLEKMNLKGMDEAKGYLQYLTTIKDNLK